MICDSQTVEASLLEYTQTQRDLSFSSTLVMSEWYDLFPASDSRPRKPLQWPQNFPNAGRAGVYFVFNESETLVYIGMSETNVQSRLGRYFGYDNGRSGPCKIKDITPAWKTSPRYVRTIAVAKSWEAPILERFLIGVLQPSDNTRGVSRPQSG